MADISKLTRLVGQIHSDVDLSLNTLVLGNAKIRLGSAFNFSFSGSLTADRIISVPDANVNLSDIASMRTLSGVAENSTNLGSFSGSTIPDNVSVKQALQSVETAIESTQADSIVTALIFG